MTTKTEEACDLNDSVFITWTVRDPNQGLQPADPATSVVAKVKDPNGVITSYAYGTGALNRIGPGTYQFALALTISGNWAVRFDGLDGLYGTADESIIPVSGSAFS